MKSRLLFASSGLLLLFAMFAVAQEPPTGGGKNAKKSDEGIGSTSGTSTSDGTASSTTSIEGSSKGVPKPGSLEDMLDKALKNHPDIRLASAKIRSAEAKLQEARDEYAREQHRIAAAVSGSYREVESAKKTVEQVRARLQIAEDAYRRKAGTQLEVVAEKSNVARFEAELVRQEELLKSLTQYPQGKSRSVNEKEVQPKLWIETVYPTGSGTSGQETNDIARIWLGRAHDQHGDWSKLQNCRACHSVPSDWTGSNLGFSVSKTAPSMNDRIRKSLDKVVKYDGGNESVALKDAIDFLQEASGIDVPIRVLVKSQKGESQEVSLMKGELSLGAWLQVIEDSLPEIRFVVREYGILVTNRDRVPEGAVFLQAFWKHKETPAPMKKDEPKKGELKK